MITLHDLLVASGLAPHGAPGGRDIEVGGIVHDSRDAAPGSLFVAVTGLREDGHAHVAAAIAAGAVAVVVERPPDPAPPGVPVIVVNNSRLALSALAAAFFGHPSRWLTVAGVTGTDGKTTTSTMLWAAWRAAGHRTGLVSTVDFRDGDTVVANTTRQTTMEAVEGQRRLAAMRDAGCTHIVIETSSHALEMHRVDDVDYQLAVYTRITSEHLDIHGDRDGYLAAKARLLELVSERAEGVAVLDRDDDFAFPRLAAIPVQTRLTYSATGSAAADLVATGVEAGPDGVRFVARTPWGEAPLHLQLAGRFNAANAIAALAAACATGATLEQAVAGITGLERVDGRMERVDAGQRFAVVIDYAHTADSLEKVLTELRAATTGRLWVVFGSAGERDLEKRPAMGAVAGRLADMVVITDEDPRDEDRDAICAQIAAGAASAGARRGETLHVIPERKDAVDFAVAGAVPGDTILFAGKGHESSIESRGRSLPWNERAVVTEAVRARAGR